MCQPGNILNFETCQLKIFLEFWDFPAEIYLEFWDFPADIYVSNFKTCELRHILNYRELCTVSGTVT